MHIAQFQSTKYFIFSSDSVQNERSIVLESSFEELAFLSKSKDQKNIYRRKYHGNLLYALKSPLLKRYTFLHDKQSYIHI